MAATVGSHVLQDLDIDSIVTALPTFTEAGNAALKERLSHPVTDPAELDRRQLQIRQMKQLCKSKETKATIADLRKTLKEHEEDVKSVGEAAADKRHAEYYTQILWPSDSFWAWLNKLDWFSEAVILFRTILLPGLSIILPMFVLIAPLIFYSALTKEPLSFEGYFSVLNDSLKKVMPSMLGKPRFTGTGGILEMGEQFVHIGIGIAMFVASIWNQVSAALAMRAVVADMRRRAEAVLTFSRTATDLAAALGQPFEASLVNWIPGQMGLFGHAWNEPERITALLKAAGELDLLAALAITKRTCFPSVGSSMVLTDLYHPGLSSGQRVYNSLTLDPTASGTKKNHVLLTGPNRGGKSTLIKSIGTAVLMAQTVGIVFARSATLPVFQNIITALAPQDIIGKLSLFEAEIEFAKEVIALLANTKGPTFLMMDEIFHGTNAHDGVEASQVFLDRLYATQRSVFSIVSTHYMDLPARYGSSSKEGQKATTQNLCMDASVDPKDPDRLVYTYRVTEGVNKYSSVKEILQERGLFLARPCGLPPQKTKEVVSKV